MGQIEEEKNRRIALECYGQWLQSKKIIVLEWWQLMVAIAAIRQEEYGQGTGIQSQQHTAQRRNAASGKEATHNVSIPHVAAIRGPVNNQGNGRGSNNSKGEGTKENC